MKTAKKTVKNCGRASSYGRVLHNKKGEPVCEACRLASNAINSASRQRHPKEERERHIAYRERLKKAKKK